jgi:biotin operon repressor
MANIRLLETIKQYTSKKPITRYALSRGLGINDREVRNQIQILRNEGYPIVSHSSKSGYYYGTSEEVQECIREYYSRANNILRTARNMERGIALDNQERLDV